MCLDNERNVNDITLNQNYTIYEKDTIYGIIIIY